MYLVCHCLLRITKSGRNITFRCEFLYFDAGPGPFFVYIYFGGLDCVCHSFSYVARLVMIFEICLDSNT